MKEKLTKFSLKIRENVTGYIFISPFILGFLLFFLYPFIQSIIFSFSELEITRTGFILNSVGLGNYQEALFVHPGFNRRLVNFLVQMANDVPLILIFSFCIATILNQKFRGRLIARVIFFLPVLVTSKVITNVSNWQGNYIQQAMNLTQISNLQGLLNVSALQSFLLDLKLPYQFVDYIIYAINRLPHVINGSAIPILIFLAALQSIPKSMYEAAYIEGATGWEIFWKITFPMISSFILVNIVYVFIDSFTHPENTLVDLIQTTAWAGAGYGVSVAMSWIYYLIIFIILMIIMGIVSKYIYYEK